MNVLFLAPRFHPDVGGVERHLLGLSRTLTARGHHVFVVTPGEGPSREEFEGITILRFSRARSRPARTRVGRLVENVRMWPRILRLLRGVPPPDLVHGHDFAFLWGLPAVVGRFGWTPRYVTFHGIEGDVAAGWAVLGRRVSAALANGKICVGTFMDRWYGTRADAVTFGAIDGEPVPPDYPSRTTDILYVGRLSSDVALDRYLEGLERVAKSGERVRWVLYGEGPLGTWIRTEGARRGLDIRLEGVTHEPERVFARHEIALAAGYLGILEAIQAGCFVVALARSPLREDYYRSHPCASHGLAVASSLEAFADLVVTTRRDPRARNEAVSSGQRIVARMTWDALADTYERVWGAVA